MKALGADMIIKLWLDFSRRNWVFNIGAPRFNYIYEYPIISMTGSRVILRMNKPRCNTVTLGVDVTEEELKRHIGNSYDLIKSKAKKQYRK